MNDALFGYGSDEKTGTFYSVKKDNYDFKYEYSGYLMSLTIVIDSTENFYQRKVYNFFDLTGQIGGLYEVLTLLGSIFVAFFAEKILMLSLISNLYQVEDKKDTVDSLILTFKFKTTKVIPVNSKMKKQKKKLK
jgi:hypothetical protein